MASYNIQANAVSQTTPVLHKGIIQIVAEVAIYFRVGENPTADSKCAFIPAGAIKQFTLPVKCSKLAVLAVKEPGSVAIIEINGVKASCSS